MIKNKSKIAQAKVMSDFLTGLAIAWFSGGIIGILFSKSIDINDLIFTVESIIFTGISLFSAIEYRKKY